MTFRGFTLLGNLSKYILAKRVTPGCINNISIQELMKRKLSGSPPVFGSKRQKMETTSSKYGFASKARLGLLPMTLVYPLHPSQIEVQNMLTTMVQFHFSQKRNSFPNFCLVLLNISIKQASKRRKQSYDGPEDGSVTSYLVSKATILMWPSTS